MKKWLAIATLLPALALGANAENQLHRIHEAANVFREIMQTSDRGIPQDILDRAQCITIVPNMKRGGFIVGAKFGKGVLVCRTANGWSAPSIVRIEGGSVGLQIGAGETDLILVVMNRGGEEKLMHDKFTLGGEAGVMAGPVGRDASAQTDALMKAEILSYSRARGVFAGITLEGSTLRPDDEDNDALYGRHVTQREILTGGVPHPAGSQPLYAEINRYAPMRHSARR